MTKRLGIIGLVGVPALAVGASGIAAATPSSSRGGSCRGQEEEEVQQGREHVTASVTSLAEANFIGVSGLVSGPEVCRVLRRLQLVNVSSGAVLATTETGDFNSSFSLLAEPKPPVGTQLQVVGVETRGCLRTLSNIMTTP